MIAWGTSCAVPPPRPASLYQTCRARCKLPASSLKIAILVQPDWRSGGVRRGISTENRFGSMQRQRFGPQAKVVAPTQGETTVGGSWPDPCPKRSNYSGGTLCRDRRVVEFVKYVGSGRSWRDAQGESEPKRVLDLLLERSCRSCPVLFESLPDNNLWTHERRAGAS